MTVPAHDTELGRLVCEIVSAYVAHNKVDAMAVPTLVRSVGDTLSQLGTGPTGPKAPPEPAVPIKNSVFANYIICLEDGKKLKMLKRHLKIVYGMKPEDYRAKWGLPANYPMVAPAHAERRSNLAKASGLGRKPAPEVVGDFEPEIQKIPKGRRGAKRQRAERTTEEK